ncbi:Mov34/MPN/PAD-1 family protein [Micromonospora chaiyaphumensis]|uniref:JAB domain-containing protein n=1 Tax=Micromonospora chaiyaphumensis TaxID=307119 RepID=A0A1C4ZME5_9ACTN|nr:Mov34/MPN/PAD-1 family protein [Micromonospora chaiyaphumensis]SCF34173.1 JAB domain-containing protein [Micromonospora chaiyaphumensis]
MAVHRRTPLPTGPASGRLLVAEHVLAPTRAALQASSGDHRSHEGLVFWIGRNVGADTLVIAVAAPPTKHHPGGVFVAEQAVASTSRAARAVGLGLVAQVHSHPGRDTRHSDGDDQLILMPYEGMFSLVVADYGQGSLLPAHGAGLHQYQHDRWVLVAGDALVVVPALLGIGAHR